MDDGLGRPGNKQGLVLREACAEISRVLPLALEAWSAWSLGASRHFVRQAPGTIPERSFGDGVDWPPCAVIQACLRLHSLSAKL